MTKKLFIVVSVDWFFVSHRLPIGLEAMKRGYEVTVIAVEEAGKGDFLRNLGIRFIPLPTTRSSTNLFRELGVFWFLLNLYHKERPDIVHHVAMKPVTYGSLAAKFFKIKKVVNALSGMGFLFINAKHNKWKQKLVLALFKWSFKNPNIRFILQNEDDLKLIQSLKSLKKEQLFLIKGSGVDIQKFAYEEEPTTEKIRVLLPARMLWDKGVKEFVEAAALLNPTYQQQVEFILCGSEDLGNPAGIPEAQLLEWQSKEIIQWIDYQKDMVSVFQNAHVVVLPSYREGLPKALIEGCAIGRPIVTTDVPGCRTVVEHGKNGLLVPIKNAKELASAIEVLIKNKALRIQMGKVGREKAEQIFSLKNVVQQTFQIYEEEMDHSHPSDLSEVAYV